MEIILALLIFQSLLLAASLIIFRKNGSTGRGFLWLYLVIIAFYFSGLYLHRIHAFQSWRLYQVLALAAAFLLNPLFYHSWISINKKLFPRHSFSVIHFIPFAAILLTISISIFGQGSAASKAVSNLPPWFKVFFNVQWLIYLVLIIDKLYSSKLLKTVKELSIVSKGGVLVIGYMAGYIIHTIELISYYICISSHGIPYLFPFHTNLYILFIFIVTNFLLFTSIDHKNLPANAIKIIKSGNGNSGDEKKEFEKLQALILAERLYARSNLTVASLAERAMMHEKMVSQLINKIAGKGFNEFINELRIEEAKELLKNSDKSVKEIQYETGFKSKTSFFEAFKRQTRTSPKEFRDSFNDGIM